jgi:hypothetical protein
LCASSSRARGKVFYRFPLSAKCVRLDGCTAADVVWQASCERVRGDWVGIWRGKEMEMRGEREKAAIKGLSSVSLPLGGVWRRCWLAFSAKRVVPL